MMAHRNCSRRPMNLRDIDDNNMKMELNEFVGMETPCVSHIDECIENMPIAMAYVPWQEWRRLYEPKEALKRGTIFRELDLPFEAAKGCR